MTCWSVEGGREGGGGGGRGERRREGGKEREEEGTDFNESIPNPILVSVHAMRDTYVVSHSKVWCQVYAHWLHL